MRYVLKGGIRNQRSTNFRISMASNEDVQVDNGVPKLYYLQFILERAFSNSTVSFEDIDILFRSNFHLA